ncbi:TadE/TadG family type IV pilus assembly protein [Thermosediminibacter litoriperuensis]|uniref:TadE-like protein n=1 Tax=Thermosediminibacter litoriperuensis TaxID=291989 RepID=A0A5S5AQ49_9FIRM|nr:TadE/TadG family type IV pilus assembly protein [Thermosediminibacter litoriperuensis]TYP53769.1 TadE-like protein [Thermosediminibacter litoriperuensis]
MRLKKFFRNQRGQAVVEFALVLPVLVLILFGILEFGRIFHSYIVITNAAREGARLGAVGRSDSEIRARIYEAAALPESDTRLQITRLEPEENLRAPGTPLTVEVTYYVTPATPVFSSILPDPVVLKSRTVMRVE